MNDEAKTAVLKAVGHILDWCQSIDCRLNRIETAAKAEVPRTASDGKLAYTMAETAEILGVSYITVFRLSKRGLLRSNSAIRTKLFSRAEIERFLKDTA